ncbi:HisA/HisF-related TIM barrel protein [Streptomyces violascens]|uniref:HisA/HisF-related TIM barrel protein n=1 Tax=Streptomyces violascens TaxID=67381 RepID=UPI00364CD1FB
MAFTLLPSLHLTDGALAHLVQGEEVPVTDGLGPAEVALSWQEQGAQWIHVLDLDAARGRGCNYPMVKELAGRLDIHVELSGGIHDDASLAAALATGAARVNLGSLALQDPGWCAKAIAAHGERIAAGLPAWVTPAGPRLARDGRPQDAGDLWEMIEWLDRAGCARFIVTDIAAEGTMGGPNLELLRQVCARTTAPVLASGGVSSLDDLRRLTELAPLGVEGCVLGRALFAGRFTFAGALAVV